MKKALLLAGVLVANSVIFTSCTKEKPVVPKENELITTLILTLRNEAVPSDSVVLRFFDIDGMGGIPPVVSQEGEIRAGTLYNGFITLLDETQDPPGDVNADILATDVDHQFFYLTDGVDLEFTYRDLDRNGRPLGLRMEVKAGTPSAGRLTIILRHYPDKAAPGVSAGDITNAGGSTDIQADFDVEVLP